MVRFAGLVGKKHAVLFDLNADTRRSCSALAKSCHAIISQDILIFHALVMLLAFSAATNLELPLATRSVVWRGLAVTTVLESVEIVMLMETMALVRLYVGKCSSAVTAVQLSATSSAPVHLAKKSASLSAAIPQSHGSAAKWWTHV